MQFTKICFYLFKCIISIINQFFLYIFQNALLNFMQPRIEMRTNRIFYFIN